MSGSYDVVLLVEQALSPQDASQVLSLHEDLDDPVAYHVLLPMEDAAARIEASMGTLAGGELMGSPNIGMQEVDVDAVRKDTEDRSRGELSSTLKALRDAGGTAEGKVVVDDPIAALAAEVEAVDGREAIILTRSHVVSEFFHLDWTSRARRKIGVPVLHLLEHENFDEQAGGGEGVMGV